MSHTSKLHVETHKDVSVLYADIVNFTPLTAALSAASLVSMLNELFGKFDEAAKVKSFCSLIYLPLNSKNF